MNPEIRWLAGCGLLLGLAAGLLWAGGMLAGDDHFDVFDEDDLPALEPWTHWEWLI